MSNRIDCEWVGRLPAFAEGLLTGKLVICAGCQYYRSAPDISELGKCVKNQSETWGFAPFECTDFRSILAASEGERWLAAAIGGPEILEKLEAAGDREQRGLFLRRMVSDQHAGERVVGKGSKRRTLNECLGVLYG